jgi:hypothetical protein
MLIESLVALAIFANVSVPVVPDPDYLQQLYPSTNPNQQQQFLTAPVNQQELQGATQPTDIMSIVSIALTAGLGYFFQKQKTTTDRRTYMSADTSLKLAQNDQASDAKVVELTYAVSCLCDIVGKFHKEELETYDTVDGVSLWTYIQNLNIKNDKDFQARYVNKPQVQPTGSQSKDKVVATFNQVQQLVTPTPVVSVPNTTKQTFASGTATMQSGVSNRVQLNRTANEASSGVSTDPGTTTATTG